MTENNTFQIKRIIKNDWAFLFFLFFISFAVYATSFFNEFVSDDIAGIAQNSALGSFGLQLKTLNLSNILNSLIYKTFGPTPFWFHLQNTIFHVATVMVVYVLTLRFISFQESDSDSSLNLGSNRWVPRFTALLFALHPIQTEGVTWISGLSYVIYTLFILLALLFFISTQRAGSYKRIAISTIFFILALFSSEKAVIFPSVLISFVYFFSKLSLKKIIPTFPFLAISGLYILYRFSDLGKRLEYIAPNHSSQLTIFNPLIQFPIAIYSYIKLIVFPINLTFYHEFTVFPKWEYYLAVLVTLYLFGGIVFFSWIGKKPNVRYYKLVAFGLLFALLALAPTLLPIGIAWLVAERYIHLGTFGLFLAISVYLASLFKTFGSKQANIWKYTLIVFCIIYIPLTIKRNLEWKNQDTLWLATIRTSPKSSKANNNMGDYYSRRGDLKTALRFFEKAVNLAPVYPEATHNLGLTYMKLGETDNAIKYLKEAFQYKPAQYQSAELLGKIYFDKKDYKISEEYILDAIKYTPDPFKDYVYLFAIYKNMRNEDKANEALKMAEQFAGGNQKKNQILRDLLNKTSKETAAP